MKFSPETLTLILREITSYKSEIIRNIHCIFNNLRYKRISKITIVNFFAI